MPNLWVIAAGLSVLVDPRDSSLPCTILMRRVASFTTVGANDVEIPVHSPLLRLRSDGVAILIEDKDVEFLPQGIGSPNIEGKDYFLLLGDEFNEAFDVEKDLVWGNGKPLVSRVRLAGRDGIVRPIHIEKLYDLDQISLDPSLRLIEAVDLDDPSEPEKDENRLVANGLLFWRHVDEAPKVIVGGETLAIYPAASGTGKLPLPPGGEDNYVVWIVNVAEVAGHAARGKDIPDRLDRDFYLLYDFLVSNAVRYAPLVEPIVNTSPGGIVNPPGQCMFGYARV